MDLKRSWEYVVSKVFSFKDGWISGENLNKVCFVCFKLGIQHIYKWRNLLIEQPNNKDIVVIKGCLDFNTKFRICFFYKDKGLIDMLTGKQIRSSSTIRWKLLEANQEAFDKIDTSDIYSDICKDALKDNQNIEK